MPRLDSSSVPAAPVAVSPAIADASAIVDPTVLAQPWQRQLAAAIRDPTELCEILGLPDSFRTQAIQAARLFPVVVPHSFLARIRRGDPDDPLLRQVLPVSREHELVAGFSADPVDDESARSAPGLLQKYSGRVLLIAAGACAVHCRYCFRRHYPYDEAPRRLEDWRPALDQIAADSTVREVILSGGDPLVLSDDRLASLFGEIQAIPHVARIRIHTRLPIVLPARVTDRLLEILTGGRAASYVVVHANHGNEIALDCAAGLRRLAKSGITTLNQAVLLAGVNDSIDSLADLCERLIDVGVLPYYLHQLDRVTGSAHFEVPEEKGLSLIAELTGRLPGYAVPRYVREVAGAASKRPVEVETVATLGTEQ